MFFITAICNTDLTKRTFGYTLDLITAMDYVNRDVGSMYECLYDYIVIEKIGPGIHAEAEQVGWYRWEHPNWIQCMRPANLTYVNWAIG